MINANEHLRCRGDGSHRTFNTKVVDGLNRNALLDLFLNNLLVLCRWN